MTSMLSSDLLLQAPPEGHPALQKEDDIRRHFAVELEMQHKRQVLASILAAIKSAPQIAIQAIHSALFCIQEGRIAEADCEFRKVARAGNASPPPGSSSLSFPVNAPEYAQLNAARSLSDLQFLLDTRQREEITAYADRCALKEVRDEMRTMVGKVLEAEEQDKKRAAEQKRNAKANPNQYFVNRCPRCGNTEENKFREIDGQIVCLGKNFVYDPSNPERVGSCGGVVSNRRRREVLGLVGRHVQNCQALVKDTHAHHEFAPRCPTHASPGCMLACVRSSRTRCTRVNSFETSRTARIGTTT